MGIDSDRRVLTALRIMEECRLAQYKINRIDLAPPSRRRFLLLPTSLVALRPLGACASIRRLFCSLRSCAVSRLCFLLWGLQWVNNSRPSNAGLICALECCSDFRFRQSDSFGFRNQRGFNDGAVNAQSSQVVHSFVVGVISAIRRSVPDALDLAGDSSLIVDIWRAGRINR